MTNTRDGAGEGHLGPRIMVRADDVDPGPVRHEEPPQWFIDKAKEIHDTLKNVYDSSFDDFIMNFRRDVNPSQELGIWGWIASHFKTITENPLVPISKRKDIYKVLLLITTHGYDGAVDANYGELTNSEVKAVVDFCKQNNIDNDRSL